MKKIFFITLLSVFGITANVDAAVYVTNYSPYQFNLLLSDGTYINGIPAASPGSPSFANSGSVLGPSWWIQEQIYEYLTVSYLSPTAYSTTTTPIFTINAFPLPGGDIVVSIF